LTLRVNNTSELLVFCEKYLDKAGVGAARFGFLAINDSNFISKLRHQPNYNPRLGTVQRVLDYIETMTQAQEDVADGL
jgi:hypothetical protein